MRNILTPYKTPYTKKRYGRNADGGYVFLSEIYEKSKVVYSYGVGAEVTFDQRCSLDGKRVYMYDPSISPEVDYLNNDNFVFKNDPFYKGFYEHILENGHENNENMLAKIDVEGAEWDGLLECDERVFRHFSQVSIEFHGINEDNAEQKAVFSKLLKYYVIFHIHANNNGSFTHVLPDILEVSFLRKDFLIDNIPYPIANLDFPNIEHGSNYLLDWWVKYETS